MEDEIIETGSQPDEGQDTPTKSIEEIEAKNAQLYARLKKTEEENKALKAQIPQEKQTEKQSTNPDKMERLELLIKGYSDSEADFLLRNGGIAALKDEMVLAAIEAQRNKQKSLEATPESSSSSPVLKQFTESDLKAMPLDEMMKHIPR